MAITPVGTPTTASQIDGADMTVTLPAGLQENDIVLVASTHCDAGSSGGTSSSGWTRIVDVTSGAQMRFQVHRKIMGPTPDTDIVLIGAGSTNESSTAEAFAYRDVDTTTPEDGVTPPTATNNTTNPDPPSATPNTSGALALIFAGTRIIDTTGTAAPAGYGNFTQVSSDDTRDTTTYGADKGGLTGGVAEDPGAFTGVSAARWIACTIILKPAATSSDAFWFVPWSEPVRAKRRLRAGANQFEALVKAAPFPETVSFDRWAYPWSQPYPAKRWLRPAAHPYQAFQPTPIISMPWFKALDEPKRQKPALRTGLQMTLAYQPAPIIEISFFRPLDEPRRYKRSLRTGQHPFTAYHPNPVIDIGWWRPLDEPRRFKPRLREASQMALTLHPEPVVSFSWIYGFSEPVRKKPSLIEAAKEKASHMIFVNAPSSTGPLFIRAKFGRRATYWTGRSDGR